MRLFMFKFESNRELHALAGDPGGRDLPTRHGPWTAVGVVREGAAPPHKMSRETIEKSISDQAFSFTKNASLPLTDVAVWKRRKAERINLDKSRHPDSSSTDSAWTKL